MPVVLLSIEGRNNAAPALAGAAEGLRRVEAATAALTAASARLRAEMDAGAGAYKRLDTSMLAMARSLGVVKDATVTGVAALADYGRAAGAASSTVDVAVASNRALRTSLEGVRGAAAQASAEMARATLAAGAMADANRIAAVSGGMGSGAGIARGGGTITRAVAMDAGRAAGIGGMERLSGAAGLLGAVGGPLGATVLGAGAAGYLGVRAIQQSNQYDNTIAGVRANTGITAADTATFRQAALGYAASGSSAYTADQLAATGIPLFSSGMGAGVASGAIPIVARVAQTTGMRDPSVAAGGITDLQDAFGGGGKGATIASLTKYADMLTKSEQYGKLPPGDIARVVSKFAPTSVLSGVGPAEALAFIAKQTGTGTSALQASRNLSGLESSLFLKPTATTRAYGQAAGVEVGPNASKDAGGLLRYLQGVETAFAGRPEDLARFMGNKTGLAGLGLANLPQGDQPGLAFTRGLAGGIQNSGGTSITQAAIKAATPEQQWKGIQDHFNADVIGVGKAISGLQDPALKAAGALLSIADAAGGWAGKAGNALDTTNRVLNQFAQDHSARPTLDSWGNRLFGDARTLASPPPAPITAAPQRTVPYNYQGPLLLGETRAPIFGPPAPPQAQPSLASALMLRGLATGAIGTPVTSIAGLDANRGGITAATGQPPRARDAAHTASLDALDSKQPRGNHIGVTDAEQRLQLAMQQNAPQATITSALGIVRQAIKEDTTLTGVQKSLRLMQDQGVVNGYTGAKNPTNVRPFADNNPGLGGLEAGFGGTAVRFGGGRDPQTEEIRKLKDELHQANDRIATLLEQVVTNTGRGGQAAGGHPLLAIGGVRSHRGR